MDETMELQFTMDEIEAMIDQGANSDHFEEDEGGEEEEEAMDDEEPCSEVGIVPKEYMFTDQHVVRLKKKHPWFNYDSITGFSSCMACSASTETTESKKCKLDEGIRIDSGRISARLGDHEKEKSHKRAEALWCEQRGEKRAEPAPNPEEAAAAAALQEQLAAARAERARTREPITRAALYLGAKSRPASDMPVVCDLIEKSAAALGATRTMEQTHRDKNSAAALLQKFSEQLKESDTAEIRVSPVLTFGADESVDRGM